MARKKMYVPISDLKSVMKAAKRTLLFIAEHEILSQEGYYVDTSEMVAAYKRMNELLKEVDKK